MLAVDYFIALRGDTQVTVHMYDHGAWAMLIGPSMTALLLSKWISKYADGEVRI
jgi:hypothetical protein